MRIEEALAEAIAAHGYDLVEVKLDGRRHLRVTIDVRPGTGAGGPAAAAGPDGHGRGAVRRERAEASHDGSGRHRGARDESGRHAPARGPNGSPSAPDLAAVDAPRPGGSRPGIRIADCQTVSELTAGVLTAMGHDPGGFQIEIASPGVDRPLTRPEHFVRFRGEQVTVTLKRPRVDGRKNFTGRLVDADDEAVTVHVLDTEEPEAFSRRDILKVRLRDAIVAPSRADGQAHSRRGAKRRHQGREGGSGGGGPDRGGADRGGPAPADPDGEG